MRRFELSDGTSNKFWEVDVEGDTLTTRWGRLGTAGQTKSRRFASDDKAKIERDAVDAWMSAAIRLHIAKEQLWRPSPKASQTDGRR